MSKSLPSLSIFFPAYNDAGTIASMVLTAKIAAQALTDNYEIIVINDGSQDHTALILDELKQQIAHLRVIQHPRNLGYGATLRSGFKAATKEWVFYTDGDAQYNPLELPVLVAALRAGVDVVNGYKIRRNDPLIRVLLGNIYNWGVKLAFGIHLKDVDCDYRLMRRAIFDSIELNSVTGSICVEMIKKIQDAGYIFAEAPVSHYHRQYGISQFFNWRRLLRTVQHLLTLWWQLVLKRKRAG
ncbi:MAG: glycosyltransferase family 2 protein [Anaerolineae bacterium CG_4_9_14_3_um_filter_57_17]|nr:glycosyltransferase [bacterium]NCT21210.1 glycosyltransferase [bacterium]OIO84242.1 MAG: glycosyl transferase [Anaerolineae bacterium CG2_30_57_67]PJB68586.1 MAG: glycosyltransferase family 2 protein [Anaerolineae bacterium CG_4_9_14_3_um_filter_57_17]